jgi:hypothetical protein
MYKDEFLEKLKSLRVAQIELFTKLVEPRDCIPKLFLKGYTL